MSKPENQKSKLTESDKDSRIEDIANVFNESPLNKIEKPAKRTKLFFAVVILALFFGLAGGVFGELALNYWLLTGTVNLPWFNKLRLEQYLPTKEIIVSKREQVTVSQDIAAAEAMEKLNKSQVALYKKISKDEKGARVYDDSRRATQGIILTNDGWMAAPLANLSGQPSEYLGLDARGETFNIKQIIPDRFLGMAYLETDARNIQAADFADREKVKNGAIAAASDLPKNSFRLLSIDSLYYNPAAPEENSSKISRFIALDGDLPDDFFGSGIILLSGQTAGMILNANLGLPADFIKARLKEAIDKEKIDQGFLGISGLSQKSFLEKPLTERRGILIGSLDHKETGIVPKSPAAKAGLRDGDILLSVNGEEPNGVKGLAEIMAYYRRGDEVEVKYLRNEKERTASVKLDGLPEK